VSVNLFESILTAVVCSVALCVQLRSTLRNWFVTSVISPPTHVLQSYRTLQRFSVMIQEQFFTLFQFFDPEVNYFHQKNTWKNSQMHIQLVKMI